LINCGDRNPRERGWEGHIVFDRLEQEPPEEQDAQNDEDCNDDDFD